MHLTGRYPDWWDGATFPHPVAAWAAGVTSEVTRDSVQRVLCGRSNAIGTGAIPADAIKDRSMKRGVADAVDTLMAVETFRPVRARWALRVTTRAARSSKPKRWILCGWTKSRHWTSTRSA